MFKMQMRSACNVEEKRRRKNVPSNKLRKNMRNHKKYVQYSTVLSSQPSVLLPPVTLQTSTESFTLSCFQLL